jgi:hypothetical protein
MVKSEYHGHQIIWVEGEWVYADTKEKVLEVGKRPCPVCGKEPTKELHDGCLGRIPGVKFACCGHGEVDQAYIVFDNMIIFRGKQAIDWFICNLPAWRIGI